MSRTTSPAGPISDPADLSSPVTLSTSTGSEWDQYVLRHAQATADHLWGWKAVFEVAFGQRCEYLVARRAGAVVGVLPLVLFQSRLFGRSVISVPYLNYGGLLVDDQGTAALLVERAAGLARDFGASHLELRHRGRQMPSLPVRQHKIGLTLDLPQTTETLWNGIDRKVRNQVRKAEKANLTTAEGGLDLVDEFYSIFARNMRDLGTPVYAKGLFTAALEQFRDRASIVIVRLGGRPVAGAVAIACQGTTLVPWASSLREFRQLCPNMLLYWRLLETAVQRGERVFDFGRSSPGGGTHQFKLQWGARAEPLHWEYVMLSGGEPPNQGPTNPKFARAIEMWKKLPLSLTNAIGPFIAKQLP